MAFMRRRNLADLRRTAVAGLEHARYDEHDDEDQDDQADEAEAEGRERRRQCECESGHWFLLRWLRPTSPQYPVPWPLTRDDGSSAPTREVVALRVCQIVHLDPHRLELQARHLAVDRLGQRLHASRQRGSVAHQC